MVLVIYFNPSGKEVGFGGLNNKLKYLYRIARFAESHCCTVRDVLAQSALLDAFIGTLSGEHAIYWLTWLTFLGSLDPERQLGFTLAKSKRWPELRRHAERSRDNTKQHAPLPTRVYGALINNLRAELDDLEAHVERLLQALREARSLNLAFKKRQLKDTAKFGPNVIARNDLTEFLARRGLSTCRRVRRSPTTVSRWRRAEKKDQLKSHVPFLAN